MLCNAWVLPQLSFTARAADGWGCVHAQVQAAGNAVCPIDSAKKLESSCLTPSLSVQNPARQTLGQIAHSCLFQVGTREFLNDSI